MIIIIIIIDDFFFFLLYRTSFPKINDVTKKNHQRNSVLYGYPFQIVYIILKIV